MRFRIEDVFFPPGVRDRIYARGIDEDMVFRALGADPALGDVTPEFTPVGLDRDGRPRYEGLARDPHSGMYLEIGFVLHPDGRARCFHAMQMRTWLRRHFVKGRR